MDDLLNEEEFLPKEYNPKRWFLIFYLAGILLTALVPSAEYLLGIEITDLSATLIALALILIPLLLSMVMIFTGKNILLLLKLKKASLKIAILHICCYLTFACFITIKTIVDQNYTLNNIYGAVVFLGFYFIIYLITIAIILPILKRSQRIATNLP